MVPLFVADPAQDLADALFISATDLTAPDILPIEVMAALTKRVRRRMLDRDDMAQALAELGGLQVATVPSQRLLHRAVELSLDHRHALPDCLYLALADDRRLALATADQSLAALAKRLGIPLWTPA